MPLAAGFPRTGVSYIAELEHEYLNLHKLSVCANCLAIGLQKTLRRCNGCKLVDYCGTDCQKSHWSKHKRFCNLVQGKGTKNAYMSKMKSPEQVFRVLIDSYRLRVDLDHAHRQENHGMYQDGSLSDDYVWATGDAAEDFQRYLDLAEQAGILPEWWRFENRMECLSEAVDRKNEESVYAKLDQDKLIMRYGGDTSIRNALSILAELVVGYDGKGSATDGNWYAEFQTYLDLHPEEKARLIAGTMDAVKNADTSADE